MPLNITGASTPRISKSNNRNPLQRRNTSSAVSPSSRRKQPQTYSGNRTHLSPHSTSHLELDQPLQDQGLAPFLVRDDTPQNVLDLVRYIRNSMFADVPNERSGMNSTRIAEVLNYRLKLPPVVIVTHLHALSPSPTRTERQVAEEIKAGTIRKIIMPGKGPQGSKSGYGVLLAEDFEALVRAHPQIDDGLKGTPGYLSSLNPVGTLSIWWKLIC
jgi:hypothetical protein